MMMLIHNICRVRWIVVCEDTRRVGERVRIPGKHANAPEEAR